MDNESTILTQPLDVTADYVVDELSRRAMPVFRCDAREFPCDLMLLAELDAGCTGNLHLPYHELSLGEIGWAWHRRSTTFHFLDALSTEEKCVHSMKPDSVTCGDGGRY